MSKYLFILLFCISGAFAQNLNQYKYVEVPQRFDFQKENNRYNLNVLTKLLLEKYGFVTYMDNEIKPADSVNNNCEKVLRAKVEEDSNAFITKLTVHLVDCQNNKVYSTLQGLSRAKDRKVAYNQALRMAFDSFDRLNYKYKEGASAKVLKVENGIVAKVNSTVKDNSTSTALDNSAKALQKIDVDSSAKFKIATEDNLAKAAQRSKSDASSTSESKAVEIEFVGKAIENGFLLQSASLPEIRMQKSNIENFYIAQIGDLPAMIYKIGEVWRLDFYQNAKLQTKIISIKL